MAMPALAPADRVWAAGALVFVEVGEAVVGVEVGEALVEGVDVEEICGVEEDLEFEGEIVPEDVVPDSVGLVVAVVVACVADELPASAATAAMPDSE